MPKSRVTLSSGTSKGVVLDLIRANGPISRVDLAERTGLTQATMSIVVRQLLDDGLVLESGRAASTGGRPTVLLELAPDARFAVGIQFGAESLTYVALNLRGVIVGRVRSRGIDGAPPDEMIGRVAEQVRSMLDGVGIALDTVVGAGVVAPGPLDLSLGTILGPPHLAAWRDVPLRDMLSEALGLPVVLDNDATAAALGDFWSGGLAGSHAHATVYMGSGIGAGILVDGIVFRGASSNAGEIGQLVVSRTADGRPQTLEELADPSAVVARALESPADAARLGLDASDEFGSFRAIATAAVRGDAFSLALLEDSASYLADAVLGAAELFDLDSVSLAGPAFAEAGPLYVGVIRRRIQEGFFARASHDIRVQLSSHVTDAAAVGAACLVLQSELAPRRMGLATRA